ncbi:hypothetical protein FQO80_22355 [Salmonella enterica]|nr:hypothetical protein [Salmonella enterica]ECJ9216283.1 hypothetical protein [Salmonella enterica]
MAKPDWEAIETAYRAGVMSLREIASHHGISEGAIGPHGHVVIVDADGNAETTVKNIAFNYIVRLA